MEDREGERGLKGKEGEGEGLTVARFLVCFEELGCDNAGWLLKRDVEGAMDREDLLRAAESGESEDIRDDFFGVAGCVGADN